MKIKRDILALAYIWLISYSSACRADSADKSVNQYWLTNLSDSQKGDAALIQHLTQLQKQRMDGTDPLGIAHVAEYTLRGFDEKHYWNTNFSENWWGVWAEDTNTGWRVNLRILPTNAPNMEMTIHVGSIVTNSGPGLLPTPDGRYAKLELFDVNGNIVPIKKGVATKLYEKRNAVMLSARNELVNTHPPSDEDASVEENYPDTISDLGYPRWKNGSFLHFCGFVSNGPPCQIGYIKFNDIFSIPAEGDYTITVQPVLFRMHLDGGTFQGYLDRVDLPSVTTKAHLVPDVK
jgi:hypothetical protein